ncbi:MFS transporter [Mesobacterium sp. TK19101]|uniref:MFS transporter n=1 Tax=Mesobacterium hydrothermale TaxID=3111907 RepID=A0ABU6HFU5_9RHOB|nr:MFS transporter [Mesobacterium sp. TK19101]MEC3860997.1 MFS transporter [Mesobacterium sp. TK19101]
MIALKDIRACRAPASAFATIGLFWGSFAALVPVLKARAGLSDGEFGLALLVASCGAMAAMALAPRVEARLRRRAMPVLAVLLAASFLAPGLATGGVGFALAMLAASIMSGTLDVVMNARVSLLEAETNRPLMNLNHAIFSFAYTFAAIAAGLMREAGIAPLTVFAVMGALTLALTVVMAQARDLVASSPDTAGRAPGWGLLLPGGLIILIAFLSEQATEGWSALHLERGLGAGAAEGALGPAVLGLTMGIGRLSGQMVAARLSEALLIRWAALLTAVGALVAAWAPVLPVAYAGFALLGLGVSVIAPTAFAWVGRQVPAEHRTRAISRLSMVGFSGFFIGPPLMGLVAEAAGLPMSFTLVALLLLFVPLALEPLVSRAARLR